MNETFLQRATVAVKNSTLIKEISELALQLIGGPISIGFPKLPKEKGYIYFIVDTEKDIIELTGAIKRKLEFDYEDSDEAGDIIILNKRITSSRMMETLVNEATPFAIENCTNIQALFKKYYPAYYRDINSTHQDKKQRSINPAHGTSFFPENSNHGGDKSRPPLTAEMLVKYLQQDSEVWDGIRRSPEVLDEACRCAKRALSEEQTKITN